MAVSTIVGLELCAGLVDLIFCTKIIIFCDESYLPVRLHDAVYYCHVCNNYVTYIVVSNLTLVDFDNLNIYFV